MERLKRPIVKDAITNITYLILMVIYFVCLNTQGNLLGSNVLSRYIDISSMVFLVISIIMFEVGYRNSKVRIFINGIEFLILAICTLLMKHLTKVFGYTMKSYTEILTYAYVTYYILKTALIYTKMKQDQLKALSDIKDIVKEEPTKKATKRKNIKKEEGK